MTKKRPDPNAAANLRERAEQIAYSKAAQSPEALEALSPEAARQMVHELHVHQIELEMQNEELRRTQVELEASRARYFDLYDLAPVGYCTLNEKGLIHEGNLTAAAMLGVARNALVNQPLSRFILYEDQDIYYTFRKQLFEIGTPKTCELRMLRAGADPFWVQLEATLAQDADGAPVCRAMLSDINERKQIENAQLFLLQSGYSNGDFFTALACYLAECLCMDYVCIDQLLGDGLIAQTVAIYFDGKFDDNVAYALKDTPCGNVVGKTICCFPREVRHLFPQDVVLQEMKAESYVGATLWDSRGQPIGLIAVISRKPLENHHLAESVLKLVATRAAGELERRHADAALKEYAEKLQWANRELQDFTYIASHDLREPLRKIHAFGERIMKKYQATLDKEGLDFLNRMVNAADRMEDLLQALLAYSQVPTHSEPKTLIDLNQVVQEVLLDLQVSLERSGGQVEAQPLPILPADLTQMRQLFQNLIANALKFHAPGVQPQIKVDWQRLPVEAGTRPMAQISIQDNGIGFDEANLGSLFRPFMRLQGRNKYEGSGMGLTICKKIVERHGGSITAKSQPGVGSTFLVTLPLPESRLAAEDG